MTVSMTQPEATIPAPNGTAESWRAAPSTPEPSTSAYVAVTLLLPVQRRSRPGSAIRRAEAATHSVFQRIQEGDVMKALLIDDHPLILSALQAVIEGIGAHVSVVGVATARAARETLAADAGFDLVLLDLQLADADGFELLSELRATYPALPVVVVSASERSTDVIRAIDLGARASCRSAPATRPCSMR